MLEEAIFALFNAFRALVDFVIGLKRHASVCSFNSPPGS